MQHEDRHGWPHAHAPKVKERQNSRSKQSFGPRPGPPEQDQSTKQGEGEQTHAMVPCKLFRTRRHFEAGVSTSEFYEAETNFHHRMH